MKVTYPSISSIPSHTANSLHVMKMCQAMAEEGHDVHLVVPRQNGITIESEEKFFSYYGVKTQFRLTRLSFSKAWRTWDFSLSSVNVAKAEDVDLVFTRHLPIAFLSALQGIPTIFEIHDVPRGIIGARIFPLLLKSKNLCRLVVLTDALRRRVEDIWPSAMKKVDVIVAHDAVDIDRFSDLPSPEQARKQLGLNEDFTVGYIGSFYPGRGIEAILSMAKQCPHFFFHLVGGPKDAVIAFSQQAKTQGISNIDFFGHVPNSEVPTHLAACELLLMPYNRVVAVGGGGNTADYCSPLKMFEYLAACRMVVSSDLPVFREVVDDKCMVLLPPEDIDAWIAAIKRASHDVSWRQNYADAGKALVQTYTWRNRARKCLSDYGLCDGD